MNRNSKQYGYLSLARVIAQVIEYARNDYFPSEPELGALESASFIAACFVAQYTKGGERGVEKAHAFAALQVDKNLSYSKRLELARAFVKEFSA